LAHGGLVPAWLSEGQANLLREAIDGTVGE
jgi:hypothetical protein